MYAYTYLYRYIYGISMVYINMMEKGGENENGNHNPRNIFTNIVFTHFLKLLTGPKLRTKAVIGSLSGATKAFIFSSRIMKLVAHVSCARAFQSWGIRPKSWMNRASPMT